MPPSAFHILASLLLTASLAQAWQCMNPGPLCSVDETGLVTLSLFDQNPGLMDSSPQQYWYGTFSVRIKLPEGYTGGTITAFYLVDTWTQSNKDPGHTEIDVEVYGGKDSSSLMFFTNVYAGGKQNLDQLYFPVDGAAMFHMLTIQWGPGVIVFSLNGVPMRILYRDASQPWPDQPMALRLSLWDSSGFTSLKADYSNGPISIQAKDLRVDACLADPSQAPGAPGSCQTQTGTQFSWNRMPTPGAVAVCADLRSHYFINSFGWGAA